MSVYISASKEYIKIRQTILDAENQHFLSYVVWNFVVPVVNLAISLRVFQKKTEGFVYFGRQWTTNWHGWGRK